MAAGPEQQITSEYPLRRSTLLRSLAFGKAVRQENASVFYGSRPSGIRGVICHRAKKIIIF